MGGLAGHFNRRMVSVFRAIVAPPTTGARSMTINDIPQGSRPFWKSRLAIVFVGIFLLAG